MATIQLTVVNLDILCFAMIYIYIYIYTKVYIYQSIYTKVYIPKYIYIYIYTSVFSSWIINEKIQIYVERIKDKSQNAVNDTFRFYLFDIYMLMYVRVCQLTWVELSEHNGDL